MSITFRETNDTRGTNKGSALTGGEYDGTIQDILNNGTRTYDTIADLKATDPTNWADNTVVRVKGYNSVGDGGGGTFYWDSSSTEDVNDGVIFQSNGVATGRWIRNIEDNTLHLLHWGGVNDRTTDNVDIVQAMIDYAYGRNYLVEIPFGALWSYNDINRAYTGTADSGTTTTVVTDTSQNWDEGELIGCFVWNTTDKSYGTITANTSSTFTAQLYIGDTNEWGQGDSYTISKHRVDVTIIDKSTYDFFRDSWTGQYKIMVNSDLPHQDSANEFWFASPYHPGFIATNTGVGGMEARASFISRWYDGNSLEKLYQWSFQENNGSFTASNMRYELVGLNSGGGDEAQMISVYNPNSTTRHIGLGIRARTDRNFYQRNWSGDNVIGYYTPDSTIHDINYYHNDDENETLRHIIRQSGDQEWYNESGDLIGRMRSDSSLVGFKSQLTAYTSNTTITSNQAGQSFSNNGATGSVQLTLPSTSGILGAEFTFLVSDNQSLSILPATGEQIYGTSGVNQSVSSSTIGNSITLIAGDSGRWFVKSQNGTWTFS